MKTVTTPESTVALQAERKRPAYDPNNLAPEDEEARKFDDTSDGIDWDEIIATTEDDFLAGRFASNSADYATQEEADTQRLLIAGRMPLRSGQPPSPFRWRPSNPMLISQICFH